MSNFNSNQSVVSQTQTAINAAGYSPALTVDGSYGPKTAAGVKWFQSLHGLTADGIIGDQTVAATIAPAPSGSPASPMPPLMPANDPVARLQAQLAQLQGKSAPALPAAVPILRSSVIHLILQQGEQLGGQLAPVVAAAGGIPSVVPVAVAPTSSPLIPAGVGLVGGGVLGLILGFPLIGAAAGTVAGLIAHYAVAPHATMHGDYDDYGFDSDYGASTITACEIGVPTSMSTMQA